MKFANLENKLRNQPWHIDQAGRIDRLPRQLADLLAHNPSPSSRAESTEHDSGVAVLS